MPPLALSKPTPAKSRSTGRLRCSAGEAAGKRASDVPCFVTAALGHLLIFGAANKEHLTWAPSWIPEPRSAPKIPKSRLRKSFFLADKYS